MRYSGSKARYSKQLNEIISGYLKYPYQWYVEPFCGGCGLLSVIDHPQKIGADSNEYVIEMWNMFKKGINPPHPGLITKDYYFELKNDCLNRTHNNPKWVMGYVGNACSYGGAWWNGYAKFNPKKNNGKGEDHIQEAYNGTVKQINNFKHLRSTQFIHTDYKSLKIPVGGSVIYCDPPYQNTKGYHNKNFNHKEFWEWCEQKAIEGNIVLVSEYVAPEGWSCVWEIKKKDGMGTTLVGNKQNTKTEKLFIFDKSVFVNAPSETLKIVRKNSEI